MTKFIVVFFSLFCGLMLSTPVFAAEETFPYSGEVTGSDINIRAGQNENFEIIGRAQKGDSVVVMEQSYGWRKIKLPADAKVYVNAGFVKMLDDGVAEVTGSKLNVRAAPGINAAVVAKLSKGELVKILETVKDWYRIEPPDQSYGWVPQEYLAYKSKDLPPARIVQPSSRNIYKKQHTAQAQPTPASSDLVTATGIVDDLPGDKVISPELRHQLTVDGKPAYVLQGYRHVLDGFLHQKVKIEARIQPSSGRSASGPVVLVTRITLVL